MEDSSYLVIVPLVLPTTPALKKNPVFAYFRDNFRKPIAFENQVVVDITSVYKDKLRALANHESQVFEWLPVTENKLESVQALKTEQQKLEFLKVEYLESLEGTRGKEKEEIVNQLEKLYGKERVSTCQFFESFEICEYGSKLQEKDFVRIFPMLGRANEK